MHMHIQKENEKQKQRAAGNIREAIIGPLQRTVGSRAVQMESTIELRSKNFDGLGVVRNRIRHLTKCIGIVSGSLQSRKKRSRSRTQTRKGGGIRAL
jgi:hypothetical protein